MTTNAPEKVALGTRQSQFAAGNQCFLNVMGEHFLVDVLEVNEDVIHVSFPARDYPVEGMRVDLEVHNDTGFCRYPAVVMESPEHTEAKGLMLKIAKQPQFARHRGTCRVPTDLTVQVKAAGHPRRHNAELVNLSSGGAGICCSAPLATGADVDIEISLPGERLHSLCGTVLHERPADACGNVKHFGVRFREAEAVVTDALARFIGKRVHELYPSN